MQASTPDSCIVSRKTTKKTCISASLVELIPGFEPGTSSLPKYMKGDCEGVSRILFCVK